MDDDYTEPVCCETPMLCVEDRDADGRLYVYYVCLQCRSETDEVTMADERSWYEE
jgi:hypothetical protein